MGFNFSASTREVLEQVVREPRFRALTTIPIFAPVTIGLILLAYGLFALSSYMYISGQLPLLVTIAINGIAIYIAFTPLHDATHRTVSGNAKFNDLLGTIACFALLPGITTRIYRYLHLEHHRYSGDKAKDPDEAFVSAPAWLLPFILAAPDALWTIWYLRHWTERPWSERIEFVIGLAIYATWHVVWLTSPYAYEFVVLWMIPQRIGMFLVTYFFAHIQHPDGVLWEEAPFQCTVHIDTNRFLRYAMLSQTEHCLHHLLPSVPFYRYHKAWESGRLLFEKQNVPVRGFFTPVENLIMPTSRELVWQEAKVKDVYDIAEDVRAFELVAANGTGLKPFDAGSHIDVQIADGLVRQYSMCNSPSELNRYVIAVKKELDGRGGSSAMHGSIQPGQNIKISEPRNNFPLNQNADDYVLIGGGIGITPILAMAHTLYELGKKFECHICTRSRSHLPFPVERSSSPFASSIHIHLDDGEDEQKFNVTKDLGRWSNGREAYICGPTGFMNWVVQSTKDEYLYWPDTSIFTETFVPRVIENVENTQFEVVLARSGKTLTVEPDEFLIDVLNRNGCGVPCSCTQGICGSCITPVVDGEPDHRDAIMSDAERTANDKMCVCVGRSKTGRLVLDL